MTNSIDRSYFIELAEQDPEDVCRRALCNYDTARRCYTLFVWGEDYEIYPDKFEIKRGRDGESKINVFLGLFVMYYLLRSQERENSDQWISEKDIPGGVTFFRGPHAIPVHLIEQRFKNNTDGFKKACEDLGGFSLDMADEAFYFRIAPRIPVAVLFWKGDDEFPAESRILFDKTITEHLATDIIFGLTVEICKRIGGS